MSAVGQPIEGKDAEWVRESIASLMEIHQSDEQFSTEHAVALGFHLVKCLMFAALSFEYYAGRASKAELLQFCEGMETQFDDASDYFHRLTESITSGEGAIFS